MVSGRTAGFGGCPVALVPVGLGAWTGEPFRSLVTSFGSNADFGGLDRMFQVWVLLLTPTGRNGKTRVSLSQNSFSLV